MTDDTTDEQTGDDTSTETPASDETPAAEETLASDETPAAEQTRHDDSADASGEGDDRVPLSELADRVATRRARSADEADQREKLFEEVSVSEIDNEDVWASLVDGDAEDEDAVGVGAEAETVRTDDGFADYIVPKAEFCQRCEHFGDPPHLGCDHEGTAILEVVDADHFKVRNCPMVELDD